MGLENAIEVKIYGMTILDHRQSMHTYIMKHKYLGQRYIEVNSIGFENILSSQICSQTLEVDYCGQNFTI